MAWTLELTNSAERDLRRLDRNTAQRIRDYLEKRVLVADNPRVLGEALSGRLAGSWRYRVGDYRVICNIQDTVLTVLVVCVSKRSDVYKN